MNFLNETGVILNHVDVQITTELLISLYWYSIIVQINNIQIDMLRR